MTNKINQAETFPPSGGYGFMRFDSSGFHTMIDKEDRKRFFKAEGDPGFNPSRNKAVIERTIKKHDAMVKRQNRNYEDQVRMRANAVESYLYHLAGGKSTPIERYFSKTTLAELRGKKIVGRIQNAIADKNRIVTLSG